MLQNASKAFFVEKKNLFGTTVLPLIIWIKLMYFRFAYPLVLYIGLPLYVGFFVYFLFFKRGLVYRYSLVKSLKVLGFFQGWYKKSIPKFCRLLGILCLLFLGARPQWVDVKSNLYIDGIDIVIALDVSGSMTLSDDLKDPRKRIVVAKYEASNFIEKRPNDEIGLVVFATDALTLAPPTQDKSYLKKIVEDLELGVIDTDSTALGKGLATAIAKLRYSTAKSKIVILLTDGRPNAKNDVSVERVIEIAQSMGVKIYTVGIGGSQPFVIDQFGRYLAVPDEGSSVDSKLLTMIAEKTGGKYFYAKNPAEMKAAYEIIDKLERTNKTTDLFTKYEEVFWVFFSIVLLSLLLELVLSLFVWKILA